MTKSMQLENRLNNLENFKPCWVFTRGHKFFIQDIATGNILKEFGNYEMIENYVMNLEEKI